MAAQHELQDKSREMAGKVQTDRQIDIGMQLKVACAPVVIVSECSSNSVPDSSLPQPMGNSSSEQRGTVTNRVGCWHSLSNCCAAEKGSSHIRQLVVQQAHLVLTVAAETAEALRSQQQSVLVLEGERAELEGKHTIEVDLLHHRHAEELHKLQQHNEELNEALASKKQENTKQPIYVGISHYHGCATERPGSLGTFAKMMM